MDRAHGEDVEPAVAVEVRSLDVLHAVRPRVELQGEREGAGLVEPDADGAELGEDDVLVPVEVEVGRAGRCAGRDVRSGDLLQDPVAVGARQGAAQAERLGLEHEEVQVTVPVEVRQGGRGACFRGVGRQRECRALQRRLPARQGVGLAARRWQAPAEEGGPTVPVVVVPPGHSLGAEGLDLRQPRADQVPRAVDAKAPGAGGREVQDPISVRVGEGQVRHRTRGYLAPGSEETITVSAQGLDPVRVCHEDIGMPIAVEVPRCDGEDRLSGELLRSGVAHAIGHEPEAVRPAEEQLEVSVAVEIDRLDRLGGGAPREVLHPGQPAESEARDAIGSSGTADDLRPSVPIQIDREEGAKLARVRQVPEERPARIGLEAPRREQAAGGTGARLDQLQRAVAIEVSHEGGADARRDHQRLGSRRVQGRDVERRRAHRVAIRASDPSGWIEGQEAGGPESHDAKVPRTAGAELSLETELDGDLRRGRGLRQGGAVAKAVLGDREADAEELAPQRRHLSIEAEGQRVTRAHRSVGVRVSVQSRSQGLRWTGACP